MLAYYQNIHLSQPWISVSVWKSCVLSSAVTSLLLYAFVESRSKVYVVLLLKLLL